MVISKLKDAGLSKVSSLRGLPTLSQLGTPGNIVEGVEYLPEDFHVHPVADKESS